MPVNHHGASRWNVVVVVRFLLLPLHIIQADPEAKHAVWHLGRWKWSSFRPPLSFTFLSTDCKKNRTSRHVTGQQLMDKATHADLLSLYNKAQLRPIFFSHSFFTYFPLSPSHSPFYFVFNYLFSVFFPSTFPSFLYFILHFSFFLAFSISPFLSLFAPHSFFLQFVLTFFVLISLLLISLLLSIHSFFLSV
jgi:hypothetical protein